MFTVFVLSCCFLAAISCKIKKVKAPIALTIIWYFHLIMLFFSALSLVLLFSGYGFKGEYTERVFFTFYAGSGVLLYGLTQQEVSGKWVYLCCFYGFPFVLAFGLLLPPLRTLAVIVGLGLLSDGNQETFRIDDNHALQAQSVDILYRHPSYNLVEDKFLLFQKVESDVIVPEARLTALRTEKAGADSVRLLLNLQNDAGKMGRLDTTISLVRR
jgi:hypothetical protein